MNQANWKRILKKYEYVGTGKGVIVIFKTAQKEKVFISGCIKEIDKDFLVIESIDGEDIVAIISLEQIAGFKML